MPGGPFDLALLARGMAPTATNSDAYMLGGATGAQDRLGMGAGGFASPLPPGGIYGTQKWAPGNGIDVFVPRGTPVYAPFDGTVGQNPQNIPSPMGPVPSFLLQGSNGLTFQATHAQLTARGPVRAGQQIGVVNDPGLDILGPYQGMPDGFQHLDITLGHGGPFGITGGDINARDWLRQIGYQGQMIQGQTRGPNGGGGGMGMGGPMGMMGGMGGGNPFMGGGPMGMGGMPGGMGGSPFGGGGPMGMPGMLGGGMGGPPGMGMMGMGLGGLMGGLGGGMPMMPPMMGGNPFGGGGGGFPGFLGPNGGPGVGGGIYGTSFPGTGAAGPVSGTPGPFTSAFGGPGTSYGGYQSPFNYGGNPFGGLGPLGGGMGAFGGMLGGFGGL